MKNRTAIECWNIVEVSKIVSLINYVPLKKQEKWFKKKHLSKIKYKHTEKDKD